jgi:cytochrome b6-f complex iron-sulfur subunit
VEGTGADVGSDLANQKLRRPSLRSWQRTPCRRPDGALPLAPAFLLQGGAAVIIAIVVAIGVVLLVAFLLAMARRRDTARVVGVLSRETRKRDRSADAISPLEEESPVLSGRQVERQAALERSGRSASSGSTAVVVSTASVPDLARRPAPPDLEALGVSRRQFLNRAILGMLGLSLAGFGTAVVGFLWPVLEAGGFGSVINVGKVSDILTSITNTETPFYSPDARAYVHQYPAIDVANAKTSGAYADPILAGYQQGWGALYQKCPHLGCRVPWCLSSQWFECPCHGSQYNRVGEKKGGPAPRGMDRFSISLNGDGSMSVNTATVYEGPPIGTNTTGQEAEGPHCV